MRRIDRVLLTGLALMCAGRTLPAQDKEPADSLVRLMSAQSAQMIQREGENVRKVIGPARFLHNDTYFLCDTAYWYVDDALIKAWGNVQLMQENTVLTSDRLDYLIDEDLAQFRGVLVQLKDKDDNILRTKYLDYNTKDSVAVFSGGASMRDHDGQVIESLKGTYDSKEGLFTFEDEVNMFSDSVFVRTSVLLYHTDTDVADFNAPLDAWKDDNMLSCNRGTYGRREDVFRFYDSVHLMGSSKEAWTDTLYYFRTPGDIEMSGSVQLTDSERHVTALGHSVVYQDSVSTVTLRRDAAVVLEMTSGEGEDARTDTLYAGADKMIYRTMRRCDVPEDEAGEAVRRRADVEVDPVSQYRAKAAEEAARKEEEARKAADEKSGKTAAEKRASKMGGRDLGAGADAPVEPPKPADAPSSPDDNSAAAPEPTAPAEPASLPEDTPLTAPPVESPSEDTPEGISPEGGEDSEAVAPQGEDDTVTPPEDGAAPADTAVLAAPPDTSRVGFALAIGSVKVYKEDMQARCDSLLYADLDSLVRMFVDPVIWNEGRRQYVADSVTMVIQDGAMRKASLMSNAFIAIQEDSTCFDQISSTEMMAYFDSTTVLERFDALGGAQAVFYIEENDALATVNRVNTKMLSAYFKDGDIDRIYYFDSPKSDAYPTVQLPREDKRMKGFKWTPEDCPQGREDITSIPLRASQREDYSDRPRASFRQTDIYFPGYIQGIYREIAVRDSLSRLAPPPGEAPADTASVTEMPVPDDTAPSDSLGVAPAAPSEMTEPSDSGWVDIDTALQQLTEAGKTSEPSRSELRRQAKEARWAERDARDTARAEAKAARALEKERARKRKLIAAMERQQAKDDKAVERYRARYEKRQQRLAAKAAARAAKRGDPGVDIPEVPAAADDAVDGSPQFEPIRENKSLLRRLGATESDNTDQQ